MTAATLVPGQTFAGDFEVERPLARGGMGAVYVARQRSTGKLRALKVMHPELVQDPAQRARFVREATVGALIDSDHVVDVVAAGIDDSGVPWIAMEFLKGRALNQHLRARGHLPFAEVAEILRQLGHALEAAHQAGVVHRDLKPANLFLAEPRRPGVPFTVKVLDFGIAKVVAEGVSTATAALGSPYWMSPEQCEHGSGITPAADVWALGALTYQLLTGRHYWRAPYRDGAVSEILLEILADPLPPASERAAEDGVGAFLPPGFDRWFSRCLVREPAQRFPTAGAALDALLPSLDSAVRAAPPTPPPPSADSLPRVDDTDTPTVLPPAASMPQVVEPLRVPATRALEVPTPLPSVTPPVTPPARRRWIPWAASGGVALGAAVAFAWVHAGGSPRTVPTVPLLDAGSSLATPTKASTGTVHPFHHPADVAVPPAVSTPRATLQPLPPTAVTSLVAPDAAVAPEDPCTRRRRCNRCVESRASCGWCTQGEWCASMSAGRQDGKPDACPERAWVASGGDCP